MKEREVGKIAFLTWILPVGAEVIAMGVCLLDQIRSPRSVVPEMRYENSTGYTKCFQDECEHKTTVFRHHAMKAYGEVEV
jgi:hypothetical protein